jgi:hypothetical protein
MMVLAELQSMEPQCRSIEQERYKHSITRLDRLLAKLDVILTSPKCDVTILGWKYSTFTN